MFRHRWSIALIAIAFFGSGGKVAAEAWKIGNKEDAIAHQDNSIKLVELEILPESFTYSITDSQSPITITQLPNPVPPRTPEQPTPTLPTPREEPLEPTTPTPTTPEIRPEIPGTITVTQFEFVGNTAFSDEELAEVIADFTNKPLTFAELLQAEAKINDLYTQAGYLNSGAFIPSDQTLNPEQATVTIEIIEGGIEEIEITGTNRLNSSYIRSRLAAATAKPLNRESLLSALQLLQFDPLIENLSAELAAGSRPELSLLSVRVTEADSFKLETFVDNSRAPSVGSVRRGVRLTEGNLFGIGDRFFASYTNTDGSNAYDFSYSIPVNARNGKIILAGGFTDTEVVEPPFDRIDITGDSRYYEFTFRQPVILTPTREFALGITASRQESETELLGVNFPLSAGSDDEGKTKISTLRIFQEYSQRSPRSVLAIRSQFNIGLDLFNSTINPEPPDSRFFSWRGQTQYIHLLAPDTLFLIRSDLQLASRAIVPLEQFGLGGFQSVRGYRQDLILADSGWFASTELRYPVLRFARNEGVVQIVPFLDFGIAWNNGEKLDPDPNSLLGIGLGLQVNWHDQLSARLDYGIPLIEVESGDRTLQEQGLYFSVIYSPF
ncbi:MAG: ShlB/FhaC/HecB family hemolysin secretion/activation protein [Oscillatoria sp. PMC 1051.18]|nr:ShlB/FhaC/HecB family hemolysin secretion/activation protein [Oscillatoria sp. PMC 1050.18]MEC5030749.1 ShlB/FhaC/HecB family hemolysin secretion/activation protein [Oscillatoria sp. PMC 1051.18]